MEIELESRLETVGVHYDPELDGSAPTSVQLDKSLNRKGFTPTPERGIDVAESYFEFNRTGGSTAMLSRKVTPWLVSVVFILVAGLASAPPAEAVASITFDQVVQGGTISYGVVGGTLVGTDILFDFFVADGTAADGVYTCSSCELNFTTGSSNGDDDGPIYTFGGGGSFVLTGGVPAMAIADGSTLLSGTWTANPPNVAVAVGSIITLTGSGVDSKNSDLAAFLGIDPFIWRYTSSEFNLGLATVNPDGTFSGTITQADLQNIKAPEPGSALLLLLGLGSLAAYRRRR